MPINEIDPEKPPRREISRSQLTAGRPFMVKRPFEGFLGVAETVVLVCIIYYCLLDEGPNKTFSGTIFLIGEISVF